MFADSDVNVHDPRTKRKLPYPCSFLKQFCRLVLTGIYVYLRLCSGAARDVINKRLLSDCSAEGIGIHERDLSERAGSAGSCYRSYPSKRRCV